MLRRDYILRMIEEFFQTFARLKALKNEQRWTDVSETLDDAFKKLIGDDAQTAARLSETELLARLVRDGPTRLVREKTFMLTTLLKEAGDAALAQNRPEASRECYLKALHLLLGILVENDPSECPEFVPKIELLATALHDVPLPMRTYAVLMQHYERTGEFAKAEDALFTMLDTEPNNGHIVEFGLAFYQRLLAESDDALTAGDLPRNEVEDGLKELKNRQTKFVR
jgi:tetratricopeptide (TPR) repeat protein